MKRLGFYGLLSLCAATLVLAAAEAVLFPGLTIKYLKIITPLRMLVVSLMAGFGLSLWFWKKDWQTFLENPLVSLAFKATYYLAPIGLAISILLYVFEYSQYPNYSFATFHLHYTTFYTLGVFLGFLWLLSRSVLQKVEKPILLMIPIWTVLLAFLIPNLGQGLAAMIKSNTYIAQHPFDTYDQKMTYSWGPFFEYMLFVRDHTPPDAIIALPPQRAPWINVGNAGLVRRFLYPRQVINLDQNLVAPESFTHMLLSQTEVTNVVPEEWVWPNWPVSVTAIIRYSSATKEVQTLTTPLFLPDEYRQADSWGILVLKD